MFVSGPKRRMPQLNPTVSLARHGVALDTAISSRGAVILAVETGFAVLRLVTL